MKICYKPNRAVLLLHTTLCLLSLCVLGYIIFRNQGMVMISKEKGSSQVSEIRAIEYCKCEKGDYVARRNHESRLRNKELQRVGRMKCEEIDQNRTLEEMTSDTGGWCPVASKTMHKGFDSKLAETLAGKTVGSFGDGPGQFKRAILDSGLVKLFDAYDGAPFCEVTSNGLVQHLDLSVPQYGIPVYDWILSLEVAEHIPRQFEAAFLSNIVRHAREGVVLSWAVPGQPGYSHVKNRKPEHVLQSMNKLGFQKDVNATDRIRNGAKLSHLKRNMNLFIRKEKKEYCDLACDA